MDNVFDLLVYNEYAKWAAVQQQRSIPMPQTLKLPATKSEAEKILDRVLSGGDITLEELLSGSSPKVARLKNVAAVLLSEIFPQRNWGQIEDLLEYSSASITKAVALAKRPGDEGAAFREEIDRFRPKPATNVSSPSVVPAKSGDGSLTERLNRIADVMFNAIDGSGGTNVKSRKREARQAKVCILRFGLKKGLGDIAEMLGFAEATLYNDANAAWLEYAGRGSFYEKVRMICKELEIAPP